MRCTNPDCGAVRFVSARQARRLQTHPAKYCPSCRTEKTTVEEEHFLYWLEWAGCHVPDGMTAVQYVNTHGVPAPLRSIALDLEALRHLL